MVWRAEKVLPAPIAAAQTAAVNLRTGQLLFRVRQQFVHVLGRRRGVAALELDGLPRPRQAADGENAGPLAAAQQSAHQKTAAMELSDVFIDHHAEDELRARLARILAG